MEGAHLLDLLLLVLDHAFQPVDGSNAVQKPRQLRVRAHMRLPPQEITRTGQSLLEISDMHARSTNHWKVKIKYSVLSRQMTHRGCATFPTKTKNQHMRTLIDCVTIRTPCLAQVLAKIGQGKQTTERTLLPLATLLFRFPNILPRLSTLLRPFEISTVIANPQIKQQTGCM